MSAAATFPGACARSTSALPPVGAVINAAPPAADRAQRATPPKLAVCVRGNLMLEVEAPPVGARTWCMALWKRTGPRTRSIVAFVSNTKPPVFRRGATCTLVMCGAQFEVPDMYADAVEDFLAENAR